MKKLYISFTLCVTVCFALALSMTSCDEGTTEVVVTDTIVDGNVQVFNNLVLNEPDGSSTVKNALNLLTGMVDSLNSSDKDITMNDSASTGANFFLRSGDLSFLDNAAIGYQTSFGVLIEYQSLTELQFDTLSRIVKSLASSSDTALSPGGFTEDKTSNYIGSEYFNDPLSNNYVYSFYLRGKTNSGVTPNPVYGMIRLDSAWDEGGSAGFKLRVDVKINTAGYNQFRKYLPNASTSDSYIRSAFK